MNKTELQAHRALGAIVRKMLTNDPHCDAVAVIDAQGMRIEWWEEGERTSRGWFFNSGGWKANTRNAADIRRWCLG